ncbi:MAG TPA: aldo/keto reductase [Steroidobacteraceae bacterium]|nr:aldo/keto reductase [Steroidobacteraceae bacterium]
MKISRTTLSRRELVRWIAGGALASALPSSAEEPMRTMATRTIPVSREAIPVIGMGSSNTFDVGASDGERAPLRDVLRALTDAGGTVIDTSPMYGRAEQTIGDLVETLGLRPRLWFATKVWTRGRKAGEQQIEESFRRLRTDRLELLQIHNLLDWREHLPTIRSLQQQGKVRYSGITHYRADAHVELERVLGEERFDWVQFNYSLAEREAERRLLPFCMDRGVAVMINRPFADGALFARVRDKPLPPWAAEVGCSSWAQYFLRFAISHPAVTCAIPATSKPQHMRDNAAAGAAPLPDEQQRRRMAEYFQAL